MAFWYYTDENQKPVGPISLDALRRLRLSGTVADHTPVVEEGSTTWRPYADVVPAAEPPRPDAFVPPEEIVLERIAASADRTAAAVGSAAGIVQASILQTFRSARTGSERSVVVASIAGMVAFFVPWVASFGSSISGFGLAREATGLLWLLPFSFGACFFLSYLNIKATPRQRVLRARWFLVIGVFWMAISLLATITGRNLFGVASVGMYLTLLSTAVITVGGFMQIDENLSNPSTEVSPS